jgi:hypothetical protein
VFHGFSGDLEVLLGYLPRALDGLAPADRAPAASGESRYGTTDDPGKSIAGGRNYAGTGWRAERREAEGRVPSGWRAEVLPRAKGLLVDYPVIVRANGREYIHDGHHRLTAAKQDGETAVKARVVDAK